MLIGCQYFNAPILGCCLDNRYIEFAPINFKGQMETFIVKWKLWNKKSHAFLYGHNNAIFYVLIHLATYNNSLKKQFQFTKSRGQTRNRFSTFLTKNVENKFSLDIINIGFKDFPIIVLFSFFTLLSSLLLSLARQNWRI